MDWLSELTPTIVIAYLVLGAVIGFLAGMLGIGGGATMVPILAWMFEARGMPREHLVHVAVATAMSTILFTSVSSVRAHAIRGAVRWDILKAFLPGILIGGVAGALLAGKFSTFGMAMFFACFVYVMATNMLVGGKKPTEGRTTPNAPVMFFAGFVISAISALVAIGGAMMSIPFMIWCGVPVVHAIGTSSAIGFPVALASVAGYIYTGLSQADLPPASIGYVYLPATVCIAVASVMTAPLGARAAHRLPTAILRKVFAFLLYILATRMLIQVWN